MPIFRNTGLYVTAYGVSALGVVGVVLRSRCVVLCTVTLHTVHKTTHRLLRTTVTTLNADTPYAVTYNLYSWRWAYRCPKHVQIFLIINHNCCIKLVPLVIFNQRDVSVLPREGSGTHSTNSPSGSLYHKCTFSIASVPRDESVFPTGVCRT